jgi:hypothetical protein
MHKITKSMAIWKYSVAAADALLEIGMAVISADLSLDEHLSRTNSSTYQNFVTSQSVVLFGTFLPGYTMLNAS